MSNISQNSIQYIGESRSRATLHCNTTRDRVVNPACRSLLLLFRGQPLAPLGAAPDAGNNASLLLTKILYSVKSKSLILKGRPYRTPFLKFFIFPGGDPLDPPFAALAFSIFKNI
jgi:hypothetical protein